MILLSQLRLYITSVTLVVVTVIDRGLISDIILFSVVSYLKINQASGQLKKTSWADSGSGGLGAFARNFCQDK